MTRNHDSVAVSRQKQLFVLILVGTSNFSSSSVLAASTTATNNIGYPPAAFVPPNSSDDELESSSEFDDVIDIRFSDDDDNWPVPRAQQPVRSFRIPPQQQNETRTEVQEESPSSSQPLKTLRKLQQMLDETDYMTSRPSNQQERQAEAPLQQMLPETGSLPLENPQQYPSRPQHEITSQASHPLPHQRPPASPLRPVEPLWTSKDRSKYKKMQQMQRRLAEERKRLEKLRQYHSSDDDDEGVLGYTLPNLPVYVSDAEGEGSDQEQPPPPPPQSSAAPPANHVYQQQQQLPVQQQSPYGYLPPYNMLPEQQYPPPQQMAPPQYLGYPFPPYGPPPPQYPHQQWSPQQHQQWSPQQHQQWLAMQQQQYPHPWYPHPFPPQQQQIGVVEAKPTEQQLQRIEPATKTAVTEKQVVVAPIGSEVPMTLAEASSRISFDSIQKLSLIFVSVALLAYCAVSPRNLLPVQYNERFYENLRIVSLAFVAPLTNFLLVCDARENDINSVITSFYTAFTVGYVVSFGLEILWTTAIRLGIFALFERNIFDLSPKVPTLVLPWVLREIKYRPKRITLFLADFLTSCVASPIVEEYIKLNILHLTANLPRNFQWYTKIIRKGHRKKRRRVAESAVKLGEPEVTNINSYVTHMLAVSVGMKLCDSTRRILMYTKASQPNKSFYAFFRGLFPIHELCGTMTALALAKRNVLGVDMALWQILFPAVFVHGMANFRGMKPIFKWNSATPWSEMQLLPWNAADDSTLPELVNKGFAKLMWLIILGRVLGYCIKNYYLISRQARKRTTTYAGKQSAFSAEIAATEMLKKTKDKQ